MKLKPFAIHTGTITSKYQFTIPKALATRFGIQRGDKIEIWVENGCIVFQPVKRKGKPSTPTPSPDTSDDLS